MCLQEHMKCKTKLSYLYFLMETVLEGGVTEKGMLMLKTDCMIKCYSQ